MHSLSSRLLGCLAALLFASALSAQTTGVLTVQRAASVSPTAPYVDIFVQCPAGYVALSGGLDHETTNLEITTLAPTFGGSAQTQLFFMANGTQDAPTGWYASVRNRGVVSYPATVSVICASVAGAVTIVASATIPLASAGDPDFGGAIPGCPVGTTALGGGVDVEYPATMKVTSNSPRGVGGILGYLATLPAGLLSPPIGWSGFARNEGPAGTVKVAAVCAPLSGVVLLNSQTMSVPAGGTSGGIALGCPVNHVAIGGGGDPDNVMTEVLLNSTPIYGSAPAYPARRADGVQPAPFGWAGDYRSYATGVAYYKFGAICVPASAIPPPYVTVYEFYNTTLRHYFRTAVAAEAAAIDAGAAGPGWVRTGDNFTAFAVGVGAGNDVCRFYYRGANSHFYTADPAECQSLRNLNPTNNPDLGWRFEELSFRIPLPTAGTCPAGAIPIHRAYNNRGWPVANDANHRFTTSLANISALQALGWTYEGIAFCAPAP